MEALKQEQCNEQHFEKVLNYFKMKQLSRFLEKNTTKMLHVVYLNKMIYLRSFNQNGNN